jgi:hypothetical protein
MRYLRGSALLGGLDLHNFVLLAGLAITEMASQPRDKLAIVPT